MAPIRGAEKVFVLRHRRARSGSCFSGCVSAIEWPVGEECFAGGLLQEDWAVAEEMVNFVSFFQRDEEELALAFAPDRDEISLSEEEVWGVREGGAEEHGGGAAIDEGDVAAQVEGDGGAVGLIAVENDLGVVGDGLGGFEMLDGCGEVL